MKKLILSLAIVFCFAAYAEAQTKVAFNIDMKYALQNGLFKPLTQDIMLKGNISPLGESAFQWVELHDTAPVDSIYTAVVEFPAVYDQKLLEYNFVIRKVLSTEHEDRKREITLSGAEEDLPAIKFNSYDW